MDRNGRMVQSSFCRKIISSQKELKALFLYITKNSHKNEKKSLLALIFFQLQKNLLFFQTNA